jgi:hypothetical protein
MQAQILLKTLVDKLVISAEGMTEIELFGVPDVTREVFVITVSLNGEVELCCKNTIIFPTYKLSQ